MQRQVITNMDLLPSIAAICGAALPKAKIDGRDMSHALFEVTAHTEPTVFYYYSKKEKIEGIRYGKFKDKT